MMGGESPGHRVRRRGPPTVIVMVGLQGSGKTTAAAKLARLLRDRAPQLGCGRGVRHLPRPAAVEQLVMVGERAGAAVYEQGTERAPVEIARWALERARTDGKDVLIVDTAGRLHVDEELMAELAAIATRSSRTRSLLVVDAMTGQDAVNVAEQFAAAVGFDGVILTKLDGDARGGAALSVRAVTGAPIMFASTGEKLDQFERFHPDRMAQRILGMGDVLTLIEKAGREVDEREAKQLEQKLRAGRVRPRRLPRPAARDAPDGAAAGPARDAAGRRRAAARRQARRTRDRPRRGDHPVDDAARAPPAGADQGVAAAAHRARVGHDCPGRQPDGQAVPAGARGDTSRWGAARCPISARCCGRAAERARSGLRRRPVS